MTEPLLPAPPEPPNWRVLPPRVRPEDWVESQPQERPVFEPYPSDRHIREAIL